MSHPPKDAFHSHPGLARRIATKRAVARGVLFAETLLPKLLLPLSILALFLATAWFGLFRHMPDLLRWSVLFVFLFSFLSSLLPLARLRWPEAAEADRLLEKRNNLPHQPVAVQEDEPAFDTPFARALWKEHQARMAERIAHLDAGLPQPDIASHDRFGLRALPALIVAIAFAFSYSNGGGFLSDAVSPSRPAGETNPDLRIDAWVTPPSYTGRAPIFLTGTQASALDRVQTPQFSQLTVRVTGEGSESVTFVPAEGGPQRDVPRQDDPKRQEADQQQGKPASEGTQTGPRTYALKITESGDLVVNGQQWLFDVIADRPPEIAFDKQPRRAVNGALEIAVLAKDDYGITKAEALIEPVEPPAADAKPLFPAPEFRLNLPRRGTEKEVRGTTSRDLTEHPLAGKRVRITLIATDGAGQEGRSAPIEMTLPARRFVNPLAAAVAEQRQVFALDTRQIKKSIALNQALALRPEETIPNLSHYLLIRSALGRMKQARTEEQFKDTAAYLWDIALGIEDGDLSQAQKRLRDAQQALSDALQNNASEEEIAKLMQELRQAMQNLMNEMAQRIQNMPQSQQSMQAQNVIRQRDLQNMMDQIENLARSGNRDAAQQMLSELQRLMNNLQAGRMQRPQQGQNQNNPMREQIDKLGEIMQEQQRLMDQTHRLNEALRDRMQRGNDQPYEQGQNQQQQGQQQQGQNGQQQPDQMTEQQLRDALKQLQAQQQGLGQKLEQLQKGLKDLGMDPGKSFGEAQQEMGNAGKALGEAQGDQAVQGQGNALNALRQGAQNMMQQMMQAMRGQQGQGQEPGEGMAGQGNQTRRDPLGRETGSADGLPDSRLKIPNEIDAQQARRILDAIREKLNDSIQGTMGTPLLNDMERRYLERLLETR
ncbi:TIGR02302 family protein [Rhizobium helianthi]|uniref:TIGR02302 family protein n=1 Tax=Rhizobium helianthi TaxID=1132695 RepID=A0ABW4M120_9HYPH